MIVCIGQAIFVAGIEQKLPWAMLMGRFIFGIGAETLEVGQADILNTWFGSNSLSFAMGLIVSFQRLVTTTMFNVSPFIVKQVSTPFAFKVGLMVCVCGFISSIILAYMNQFAPVAIEYPDDPDFDQESLLSILSHSSSNQVPSSDSPKDRDSMKKDHQSPQLIFTPNSATFSLYEGTTVVRPPSPKIPSSNLIEFNEPKPRQSIREQFPQSPQLTIVPNSTSLVSLYESTTIVVRPEDLPSPKTPSSKSIESFQSHKFQSFKEQLRFPPSFYYLIIITILIYGSVTPFIYIGAECILDLM
jgi:hypothetical protein